MEIRKTSHDTDGGKLVETIKISRMRGKGKATINVAEMSVVRGIYKNRGLNALKQRFYMPMRSDSFA